jgi:ribosomal protein S18 acetylase RimI-like enzyme
MPDGPSARRPVGGVVRPMVHHGRMSELTRIPAPDGVAPAAQYTHVVLGTGRFVAVSGQLALDEDGKLVGAGDPAAQARQVFENLRRCLAAARPPRGACRAHTRRPVAGRVGGAGRRAGATGVPDGGRGVRGAAGLIGGGRRWAASTVPVMNDMDDDGIRTRIRPMALSDCERVAEIRIGGWQSAYQGLVPQSYLDALDVAQDAERRRAYFSQADGSVLDLVAERDGQVVGWACHGPYRDGEVRTEDAELYAIYVAPGRYGDGIGQALLQESLRHCTAAGHPRILLWVLKDNARARRFYERAGFRPDGAEEPFEVDGVEVPEVRYARELAPA